MAAMIKNSIGSQTFNDGLCRVYAVQNLAAPGDMPQEGLVLRDALRYEERTVGTIRYNNYLQNDARVDRLIRVPFRDSISSQDICIPNDGKQYRILKADKKDTRPPSLDLNLQRIEVEYAAP